MEWVKRHAYLLLGHLTTFLGFVGIFVPGLPTVPFLLVSAWAYARSCPYMHQWIINHKWFGPVITSYQRDGVIPLRAKILAIGMMAVGMGFCLYHASHWAYPAIFATCVVPTALYILSRPSRAPGRP